MAGKPWVRRKVPAGRAIAKPLLCGIHSHTYPHHGHDFHRYESHEPYLFFFVRRDAVAYVFVASFFVGMTP